MGPVSDDHFNNIDVRSVKSRTELVGVFFILLFCDVTSSIISKRGVSASSRRAYQTRTTAYCRVYLYQMYPIVIQRIQLFRLFEPSDNFLA